MSRRSSFVIASLVLSSLFCCASLLAQAAPAEIESAKNPFRGAVNSNAVMIRSGPADSDYPAMRVDKDTQVVVVGIKFNWLKIVPPEGSFSYVAKLYVERHGDGTVGQVTKDNLYVWAGSSISKMKSVLQCKLARGAEVSILGEADEYYMIKPPADAYLWVHQNLVTPLGPVEDKKPEVVDNTDSNTAANPLAGGPTTAPSAQPSDVAGIPTTLPTESAVADAGKQFDALEADYAAADLKPLEEQPVADLLAGYEKIAGGNTLPSSMRKIADQRVATLRHRGDAKVKLLAIRTSTDETAKKLQVLQSEQQELQQRMASMDVQAFTAVGTLQTSSLQGGGQMLYRLTDPANGRTVVYMRSADAQLGGMIGQFLGVRGELVNDQAMSLRVVNATETAVIDPAKVNKGVTAVLIPASMLAKDAAQASVDGR